MFKNTQNLYFDYFAACNNSYIACIYLKIGQYHIVTPPPQLSILGGHNTHIKMHLSCVSWWEWTKWIYSFNLFIYTHCMNWFIMILIYNYFLRWYIYPWMDPVIPQYIYMSSLLQRVFWKKNLYFIVKAHESTAVSR